MKQNTLPKRTLLLWQLRVLILNLICVSLCLFFSKDLEPLKSVALVISIIALCIIVFYLPAFFKSYEIMIKGEAVIINYGVLIKTTHIMPYSRLIYAQSFATPLARLMGVASLTLKAARGWILVPELCADKAQEIIDSLTREGNND